MWVLIEAFNPPRVEGGRPADDAVHVVVFGEQQLRQVAAVLTRDASYKCNFFHIKYYILNLDFILSFKNFLTVSNVNSWYVFPNFDILSIIVGGIVIIEQPQSFACR